MELTLRTSRTAPALSEQMLVVAARHGDDQAFEELYSRYRRRIFAFILNKVRDHGRAEDIAQEVFMAALRRLRASDQQISFKPWIYEIAKNACIDEFRRGSRSREVPLEPDEDAVDRRPMISIVPTPPDAVENRQRLDDLRGAFGGLSEGHHQLLVLREFEGRSYDEIGDQLGMTRQMVESGLFRARRKLSEEYDELASGRRCMQIQTAIDSGQAQSITSLGVRERRRIARHLAHCQTCRQSALAAGVDKALLKPRSIAAKIAGLLPFPIWRFMRRGGRGPSAKNAGPRAASRHLARGSLHGAIRAAQPTSVGQAAVALATLAIAGAGTGLVVGLDHHHASPSSSATLASAIVQPAPASARREASRASWPGSATTAAASSAHSVLAIGPGSVLFRPAGASGPTTASPRHQTSSSSGSAGPSVASAVGAAAAAADAVTNTTLTTSTLLGKADGAVGGVKQILHSGVSGVKTGVGSTVTKVRGVVGSTTSGVKKTVRNVISGLNATAGSAANSVTHVAGSTDSTGSTGSTRTRLPSGSNTASKSGSAALKSVGAKLMGSGASTGSTTSAAPSGPVASVTTPLKSAVSGLLNK